MASDQDDQDRRLPPGGPVTTEHREVRGYFVQVPLARSDDKVNLRVLARHIGRYKLMISLFVVVPVVLAAVVVTVMRPVYHADVLLTPS
jgi:hypothetical protein